MAKSNAVVTVAVTPETISWTVRGTDLPPIVLERSKLSAAFRAHAETHGLVQRGSDRAALSRDPKTGKPATPEQKHARIAAWAEHAMSGTEDWRMTGERKPVDTETLLRELMARFPGLSREALDGLLAQASAQDSDDEG